MCYSHLTDLFSSIKVVDYASSLLVSRLTLIRLQQPKILTTKRAQSRPWYNGACIKLVSEVRFYILDVYPNVLQTFLLYNHSHSFTIWTSYRQR